MSKKSNKYPLSVEQRLSLNRVHIAQIILEVSLVVLFLYLITNNISIAFPIYGIVAVLIMLSAGLVLLLFGIIITAGIFSMKYLGKPLTTRNIYAKRWLLTTWLCVPIVIFLVIFSATSASEGETILTASVTGIVALVMLVSIIGSLVSVHLMWRRFNKKKRAPIRIISYGVLGLLLATLALFGSYTTTEVIEYNSISVTDSNLELGQTEVRQIGRDGQKQIKHNLIFGTTVSETNTEPIDEQIAKGSKRFQYMYCSNGSYYYYTAEQFKNPDVGYTHQSPDQCAQNGKGTQTTLADVPPAETIVQQVPTYRSPTYTTCTESYFGNSFSCSSY